MKYLIIAALCFGATQAFSNAIPPLEQTPEIESRIVGGWTAAVNQFPWQVIMQITVAGGASFFCGGSLLSNQWVLTAAHCAVPATNFNVRLGSNNLTAPVVIVNTNNRTVHPNYNPNTLANNIAVVRLPTPIGLTPSIQPIRLPTLSQVNTSFEGQVVAVSGFGRISDTSTAMSNTLQWVNVTVISNTACAGVFGSVVVTPDVVCARGTQFITQNTCNGDDGGALVYYQGATRIPIQIGSVSFVSDRGCSAGDPSGYVRISKYLSWISVQTGIALFP